MTPPRVAKEQRMVYLMHQCAIKFPRLSFGWGSALYNDSAVKSSDSLVKGGGAVLHSGYSNLAERMTTYCLLILKHNHVDWPII